MAIERVMRLRGYETDIINGTCIAVYDNQLVENSVVIDSKRHRENMDLNTISELKKSAFVDHALLTNANKLFELQSDKMILQTELLTHEENFKMAKTINDEIYAENQKLKADKEKLLADMVKLDENIVNLNAQIVASKKGK